MFNYKILASLKKKVLTVENFATSRKYSKVYSLRINLAFFANKDN